MLPRHESEVLPRHESEILPCHESEVLPCLASGLPGVFAEKCEVTAASRRSLCRESPTHQHLCWSALLN